MRGDECKSLKTNNIQFRGKFIRGFTVFLKNILKCVREFVTANNVEQ